MHKMSSMYVLYGPVHLCVEYGDMRAARANKQGMETPTYLSVLGLQHGSSARPAPHGRVPGALRGAIDVCHLAATMRVPVSCKPV